MSRVVVVFLAAAVIALAPFDAGTAPAQSADRIIVRKSLRRIELLRGAEVIGTYKIVLGLDPSGPKQREGDFRTPEGRYRIARRNPRSEFFLALQISYPNDGDMKRARRNGWQPGGMIMIHGLPNRPRHPPEYYESRDWTNGCIAVSNADMVEIWLLTGHDTPVEILP